MPAKITMEAIQYTPGGEPVIAYYSADGNGPLARTTLFHTTQAALTERAGGVPWNDKHVLEALEAHLVEFEVTADVPMAIALRAAGVESVPTGAEKVAEPAPVEVVPADPVTVEPIIP